MTGAWFRACVERALSPTLKPGDVVIMDNLPAHNGPTVRRTIKATGAQLRLLPPYFNPNENTFAKMKALLRKAAARTIAALECSIADAIDTLIPAECANYFAAAGYVRRDRNLH